MFAAVGPKEIGALAALIVLLLVSLVVGVYILVGLFNARSLLYRELSAYFLSPIAYVVLVVFLAVTGFSFNEALEQLTAVKAKGVEDPMQLLLGNWWSWLVFLVIPPVLTMRLFAEERSSGTLEVLMTSPLRDWQVVLSKYVACFAFYLFMWVPTLVYLPILLNLEAPTGQVVQVLNGELPAAQMTLSLWTGLFLGGLALLLVGVLMAFLPFGTFGRLVALFDLAAGAVCVGVGIWGHYKYDAQHWLVMPARIDPMPVLSSYLGLILAGAMLLALGLLVSSLVRDQLVAFLIALGLSLVFIVAGFWRPDMDTGSPLYRVVQYFSVPLHFNRDFSRGVIDPRHLVLYGSVALFCLFLTVRSLESRRWR